MFNLKSAFVATAALVLTAGTASAGTATYNRYENTQIYNGYTETEVTGHINSESVTKTYSNSTKVEAIAE